MYTGSLRRLIDELGRLLAEQARRRAPPRKPETGPGGRATPPPEIPNPSAKSAEPPADSVLGRQRGRWRAAGLGFCRRKAVTRSES